MTWSEELLFMNQIMDKIVKSTQISTPYVYQRASKNLGSFESMSYSSESNSHKLLGSSP